MRDDARCTRAPAATTRRSLAHIDGATAKRKESNCRDWCTEEDPAHIDQEEQQNMGMRVERCGHYTDTECTYADETGASVSAALKSGGTEEACRIERRPPDPDLMWSLDSM